MGDGRHERDRACTDDRDGDEKRMTEDCGEGEREDGRNERDSCDTHRESEEGLGEMETTTESWRAHHSRKTRGSKRLMSVNDVRRNI